MPAARAAPIDSQDCVGNRSNSSNKIPKAQEKAQETGSVACKSRSPEVSTSPIADSAPARAALSRIFSYSLAVVSATKARKVKAKIFILVEIGMTEECVAV